MEKKMGERKNWGGKTYFSFFSASSFCFISF